ncbi:MAG TPA: hypothetical protein VMW50_14950 [Dehalococcoidia bacterium]|nr:hypothetical protein [Dehalococcoidia bacterium]
MVAIGEIRTGKELGRGGTHKFIWHDCLDCGKGRWTRLIKGKPETLYCSLCRNKRLGGRVREQSGEKNPAWKGGKVKRVCLNCGQEFEIYLSQVKHSGGKFCSHSCSKQGAFRYVYSTEECRRNKSKALTGQFGEKSRAWKGGKVKRVCLNCEQEFEVQPSQIKYGGGKFCSCSCRIVYYRKHGAYNQSPNKPEKTLIKLIQNSNLPFKYVGGGEIWLGNHNPDFINVNGKKQVIECFGTYWHPLFDGAQRTEHYKQYGFSTLIIWDNELADEPKLLDKIKTFTRRRIK